jgi:transposase-like protein
MRISPTAIRSRMMSRRLDDVRLAVMMLDGIEIAERTHVVALGITTDGVKIPLGLWEGSTENATLVRDSAGRSRRPRPRSRPGDPVRDRRRQALRKAIRDVFGEHALVHRCHRHKERNVCDLLPERDRDQGARGCARPGHSPAPTWPSNGCSCSSASSRRRGRTPPPRCARAWPTR